MTLSPSAIRRARADRRLAQTREALRDKVIAVTGGARGIGFETATQLLSAGARVAIGDIDADAVGKAAADLGVEGLELDVTESSSFEAFLDEVERRLGPVDVLINNAGIMPVGPFLDYSEALIRRTVEIDLVGVMLGSRAAARRMVPAGRGQIVNVSSVAGRLPNPGLTIYNGAKAGVIEFSEALDAELTPHGVRVSAVLPTFTRTALIDGLTTGSLVATVTPEQVAARVIEVIARPRVRVTAPSSMGWVGVNTVLPHGLKNRLRRLTGTDSIFLHPDERARADYNARIGR
ncbi:MULTISPECIES: SDR family oxidoreductase [unclassified Gordonia (in: high G+C Gram-positive bacteria)]|uniref:SDR family oxidoreductase n=1 Tax=unclassified Gordonia (in: high G+C Gram-positive bacteria) TaxID=2657482 RepID=UPI001FFECC54|nr:MULTISPECIES: SDR family oxidoreductase [unclassified Gordonia (in: high G+C Gram-positive bacteria)]UQE74476.1 SDR family oxidoreductase [Gordonia sp. PP30]